MQVKLGDTIKAADGSLYCVDQIERPDGKIGAWRKGGGFHAAIPYDDVLAVNPEPTWRDCVVGFDEEAVCLARVTEEKWNGWEIPHVDRENLKRMLDWFNAQDPENSGRMRMELDTIIWDYEGEPVEVEPVVGDDGRLRWNVGSTFGFTWVEYDDATYSVVSDDGATQSVQLSTIIRNDDTETVRAVSGMLVGETVALGGGAAPGLTVTRVK